MHLDIYRAAKLMIAQHGPKAATTAAGRADRLLEHGDVESAAFWLEIIRAIDELRRERRLLADELVQQRNVFEVAAPLVLAEQVAQDGAACSLISSEPDKDDAPVGCRNVGLGQKPADHLGRLIPRQIGPDLLLPGVVIRQSAPPEQARRRRA